MTMIAIPFGTLHKAAFLGRPNRFLLRCALEESGEEVEVHLADPGRLRELLFPGAPCGCAGVITHGGGHSGPLSWPRSTYEELGIPAVCARE